MKAFQVLFAATIFLSSCQDSEHTKVEISSNEQAAANVKDKTKSEEMLADNEEEQVPTTPPDKNATNSQEEIVKQIRALYQQVNAKKLKPRTINFQCETDGSVQVFSDAGKVVKVAIDWGFLGDGTSATEFYYQNEKVFFIYDVFVGGPAGEDIARTEKRAYVRNDEVVKYMTNQIVAPCNPCQITSSDLAYRILQAYKAGNIPDILCQ